MLSEVMLGRCEKGSSHPPDPYLSSITCDINDSRSNQVYLFIRHSSRLDGVYEMVHSIPIRIYNKKWPLLCGFLKFIVTYFCVYL